MATVINPNTYGGRFNGEDIITKTLLANNSVERGLLNVRSFVKNKEITREMDIVPRFQSYKDKGGSVDETLNATEFVLDLKKYMSKGDLRLESFRTSWESQFMRQGSVNDMPEQTFVSAVVNYIASQLAITNDILYWLGREGVPAGQIINTGGDPFPTYTGLLPKALADAEVQKMDAAIGQIAISNTGLAFGATTTVTHASGANAALEVGDEVTFSSTVGGTTQIRGLSGRVISKTETTTIVGINSTGFTAHTSGGAMQFINSSNVTTVIAQIMNNVPLQAIDREGFVLLLPARLKTQLLKFSAEQLKSNGFFFVSGQRDGQMPGWFYGEYRMEFMQYWRPNTIWASNVNDMYLGVDLLDEEQELNIIDLREISNDDVLNYRAVMKSDTNYSALKARDFLLYRPS